MRIRHFIRIGFGALVGYLVLFSTAKIFFNFVFPNKGIEPHILSTAEALHILPSFSVSFLLTFTVVIYVVNSFIAKKWLPLPWSKVYMYMGLLGAFGPTGEVAINTISRVLTHQPLWLYQLLPAHGGDTSLVMSVIWPLYGFHIYCFHAALKARRDKTSDADMALFVGIDAITLEVIANLFTLSFFYSYIFYYLAGDLNHLSTAAIFIPYVISGYLAIKLIHNIERTHHHLIAGTLGFLWGWILIFVL